MHIGVSALIPDFAFSLQKPPSFANLIPPLIIDKTGDQQNTKTQRHKHPSHCRRKNKRKTEVKGTWNHRGHGPSPSTVQERTGRGRSEPVGSGIVVVQWLFEVGHCELRAHSGHANGTPYLRQNHINLQQYCMDIFPD
jgi:hypothetical protein